MKKQFLSTLQQELSRLDTVGISKRRERVIEKFTDDPSPQAVIQKKARRIFNSNDYLGLRFHPALKKAEHEASEKYGVGPGAVRFISGSLEIYHELEHEIAKFHNREDAMVISSAFAANVAVIPCFIKGQSKDSLVSENALVVSDELNHRSIIEGVRAASIDSFHKAIFKHMDAEDLRRVLKENEGKFTRVVVVTDGIFSMLGEYQDIKKLRAVCDAFEQKYEEGIVLIVDDAHGVGCFGKTGRGVEEVCGARADILVGTLGKAFGVDGGYIVGDTIAIDYLREAAATYIYSNPISPGAAGAGLAVFHLMQGTDGKKLLAQSQHNIAFFKSLMKKEKFQFSADSHHPIQPLFVGDSIIAKSLAQALFDEGFLVTNINYPVVPKGRDEIRIQISAIHTEEDIRIFVETLKKLRKTMKF